MNYKLLGRSGLRVSELSLGTMTFGEDWGWGAPKAECEKMLNLYTERGGNFIDTACNYTEGSSESIIGELTQGYRQKMVIATKYTLSMDKDDPNAGGNSRKNMVQTVERSLKRLRTDYIDLLYLHMWDFTTPIDEVMRAFQDLVSAGKIVYAGISDTPAWVISSANTMADLRGWAPFVAMQLPYSLAGRSPEREALPMAKALDIAVTAWGLLEGGALTGKYNKPSDEPKRNESISDKSRNLASVVQDVAEGRGATASQVAINWVRQSTNNVMIPILGARTAAQVEDNLGCLDFSLTEKELKTLSEASPIELNWPRSFLESDGVRNLIFGNTFARTVNHRL